MIIYNHKIKLDDETIWLDIDVSDIHWNNNGIGRYEYWGFIGFDKGEDYIEEFTINKISIDGVPVTDSKLYNTLYDMLIKDGELYNKIEVEDKYENF
jgi:hypothetical protein